MPEDDKWWEKREGESDQDWANRIEEHNPSEEEEVRASNLRARALKRAARESGQTITTVERIERKS